MTPSVVAFGEEAWLIEMGAVIDAAASANAGTSLRFGGAVDGARTYLAAAGGIAAEVVLGSASTDPVAGFGGLAGRRLQVGDLILSDHLAPKSGPTRAWPVGEAQSGIATEAGPRHVRVVPGPHLGRMPELRVTLSAATWRVTPRSDRVAIRLVGPCLDTGDLDVVSLPMLPGAIQVPPNGQPIVLMPDAPTIGGYPVPAVVAVVDRCISAQLRPGDEVVFDWAEAESMRLLAAERHATLASIAASLAL